MRTYNIPDLLKVLNIEKVTADYIVKNYDSFNDTLKYSIIETLWDGFYELKEKVTKLKYEQLLIEVELGKLEFNNDLQRQAEAAAWKEFEDILSGKRTESDEINKLRDKLKGLSIPITNNG